MDNPLFPPTANELGRNFASTRNIGVTIIDEIEARENARIRSVYSNRPAPFRYSMFEPAHMLAVQERERKLLNLLAEYNIASYLPCARILEVGCGSGFWLRELVRWGAEPHNMFGIDLLPDRIAQARRLCPAAINLACAGATQLHFPDTSFDLILQSTVFSSVLDQKIKRQISGEMLRVLRPSGFILWYDFHLNNPANPDVQGIKKREINALFPRCKIQLHRLTLAPPLGRTIARFSTSLYQLMSFLKPLTTHYLGVIKKYDD